MRFISESIATFVVARNPIHAPPSGGELSGRAFRKLLKREKEVLIAQIPQAMRKHLIWQGYIYTVESGLGLFAISIFNVYGEGDWSAAIHFSDLILISIASLFMMICFSSVTRHMPLNRELRFYKKHGKWRWEH